MIKKDPQKQLLYVYDKLILKKKKQRQLRFIESVIYFCTHDTI